MYTMLIVFGCVFAANACYTVQLQGPVFRNQTVFRFPSGWHLTVFNNLPVYLQWVHGIVVISTETAPLICQSDRLAFDSQVQLVALDCEGYAAFETPWEDCFVAVCETRGLCAIHYTKPGHRALMNKWLGLAAPTDNSTDPI